MNSGTAEQEQKRVITEPGGATVPGGPRPGHDVAPAPRDETTGEGDEGHDARVRSSRTGDVVQEERHGLPIADRAPGRARRRHQLAAGSARNQATPTAVRRRAREPGRNVQGAGATVVMPAPGGSVGRRARRGLVALVVQEPPWRRWRTARTSLVAQLREVVERCSRARPAPPHLAHAMGPVRQHAQTEGPKPVRQQAETTSASAVRGGEVQPRLGADGGARVAIRRSPGRRGGERDEEDISPRMCHGRLTRPRSTRHEVTAGRGCTSLDFRLTRRFTLRSCDSPSHAVREPPRCRGARGAPRSARPWRPAVVTGRSP